MLSFWYKSTAFDFVSWVLEILTLFLKIKIASLSSHDGIQSSITSVPGDLMLYSGFHRHPMPKCCSTCLQPNTHVCANKIDMFPIHIIKGDVIDLVLTEIYYKRQLRELKVKP